MAIKSDAFIRIHFFMTDKRQTERTEWSLKKGTKKIIIHEIVFAVCTLLSISYYILKRMCGREIKL